MKKAGALASVTAIAAVSSAALVSAAPQYLNETSSSNLGNDAASGSTKGEERDRFAPRFDGLRFIETLVTAHR